MFRNKDEEEDEEEEEEEKGKRRPWLVVKSGDGKKIFQFASIIIGEWPRLPGSLFLPNAPSLWTVIDDLFSLMPISFSTLKDGYSSVFMSCGFFFAVLLETNSRLGAITFSLSFFFSRRIKKKRKKKREGTVADKIFPIRED